MMVEGVKNCAVYKDDIIVFDFSWEDHLDNISILAKFSMDLWGTLYRKFIPPQSHQCRAEKFYNVKQVK